MVDLGLDITRTRGRAAKPVAAVEMRDLTDADLALLDTEKGVHAPTIKKIRESHHALARALASGMRPAEAAQVTGYSLSRISIIKADPAFQDLMTVYTDQVGEIYANLHDKMAAMAVDVVEELHERLHEDPEEFTTNQLLDVAKTFADRTGHGPQTKTQNVNVNIDLATRLEAGRRRADEMRTRLLPSPPHGVEPDA
jgi:hypothetical protein